MSIAAARLFAQEALLSGTVTDPSGSVLIRLCLRVTGDWANSMRRNGWTTSFLKGRLSNLVRPPIEGRHENLDYPKPTTPQPPIVLPEEY
jgi:hypothetical protein